MTDAHKAELVHIEPENIDPRRMHPLVHAALSSGPIDPDMLNRLLDVQERYEANEARKAYTRAKAALKGDLPAVVGHDSTVHFETQKGVTHYTHSSLASVMDAITGPLTRHGFSLAYNPQTIAGERSTLVRVTCRLTHTEGHFEEATLDAPADTSGNKNPAQAIMSTITLLSRYTALGILGIATKDMREPTGESEKDDGRVDPKRNLAAMQAVVAAGRTKADAEGHIGRPVSEWTKADRMKLRAWLETPNEAREETAASAPVT